jgi:glycosyltransferase involved in cell wall biosynthesis
MKSGVTVVIPTINRASLLDALKSVINQTLSPYEVIIVDDSKDQSVESNRFKVIKTGGLVGVSKARNLGLLQVDTEFTALLDDDDYWQKGYLEKQLTNINNLGIDFGITGAMVNGRNRPRTPLKAGVDPYELLYGKPHLLRSKAYLPTSTYVFRTKIIEKIRFNESITDRENLKFIRDCFRENFRIYQNPESLVTINYSSKNSISRINIAQEINWYQYLRDINENWSENFIVESARNFIRNGDRATAKLLLEHLNPKKISLHKLILSVAAR